MSLFSNITAAEFMRDYWQQKALVVRQAAPEIFALINGDELAGLACEEEVESRIISGSAINNQWQCRQGPFAEADFLSLPEKNWTLLVQGVDQWDVSIRALLDEFSFLPRWRLEDIMVSYAPAGGSVGPHFDYYDVFLMQVSGNRQWRLGQDCDAGTALMDNDQVKLLAHFETHETHELVPGDMLYIPAGRAHWGVALGADCITLSVGLRAPSAKETVIEAMEIFARSLSAQQRYQDTPLSIDQHPHKINRHAHGNIKKLLAALGPDELSESLYQAFGQLVTETRHQPSARVTRSWTTAQVESALTEENALRLVHSAHSRLAFSECHLFVNGHAFGAEESFSRMVCNGYIDMVLSAGQLDVLVEILNQGATALIPATDSRSGP